MKPPLTTSGTGPTSRRSVENRYLHLSATGVVRTDHGHEPLRVGIGVRVRRAAAVFVLPGLGGRVVAGLIADHVLSRPGMVSHHEADRVGQSAGARAVGALKG
jgi:hypothetical protein